MDFGDPYNGGGVRYGSEELAVSSKQLLFFDLLGRCWDDEICFMKVA